MEDSTNSVNSFFNKAADLRKNNKSFRSNIIMLLLHAMVVKQTSRVLNVENEQKVLDFFRYLRSLSS